MKDAPSQTNEVKELVAHAYDLGAESYAKAWHAPWEWLELERAQILKWVKPGSRMIDVGCGSGRDCAYWAENGLHVTGIDISAKTVRLARRTYPQIRFLPCDVFEVSSLHERFDIAWCSYSLLHIPPPQLRDAVKCLSDILVEHGVVFIGMALSQTTEKRFTTYAGMETNDGTPIKVPIFYWNEEELRREISHQLVEVWHRSFVAFENKPAYSGIWQRR
jgi:2-polyprenyl-3-methyl-5-hydroxy-6-metoxy-1,4-benzoquinol methylase